MIRVGGMTPLTTIDFPGRLAAVLYLQGCPWRCGYCHNPELLPARGSTSVAWADVEAFLRRRTGLLDGVVFSGGEPTAQAAMPFAAAHVRSMGFAVGLHTGGMYPQRLRAALPALDWVGLDIKAPEDHYDRVTGRRDSARGVLESLDAVQGSGVAYECRTTWHDGLYPLAALQRLRDALLQRGVRRWVLQECRDAGRGLWRVPLDACFGLGFESFELRRG